MTSLITVIRWHDFKKEKPHDKQDIFVGRYDKENKSIGSIEYGTFSKNENTGLDYDLVLMGGCRMADHLYDYWGEAETKIDACTWNKQLISNNDGCKATDQPLLMTCDRIHE